MGTVPDPAGSPRAHLINFGSRLSWTLRQNPGEVAVRRSTSGKALSSHNCLGHTSHCVSSKHICQMPPIPNIGPGHVTESCLRPELRFLSHPRRVKPRQKELRDVLAQQSVRWRPGFSDKGILWVVSPIQASCPCQSL